jgi:hypothetical protein
MVSVAATTTTTIMVVATMSALWLPCKRSPRPATTCELVHRRAALTRVLSALRKVYLGRLVSVISISSIRLAHARTEASGEMHLGAAPTNRAVACAEMFWDFCLVHCDAHSFSSVRILAVAFVTLTLNWSWRTKQTEAETTGNNNVSFDFEALPCAAPTAQQASSSVAMTVATHRPLNDFLALPARHVVRNLRSVLLVVHHQQLQLGHVAHSELQVAARQQMPGLFVGPVTNVRVRLSAVEPHAHARLHAPRFPPAHLRSTAPVSPRRGTSRDQPPGALAPKSQQHYPRRRTMHSEKCCSTRLELSGNTHRHAHELIRLVAPELLGPLLDDLLATGHALRRGHLFAGHPEQRCWPQSSSGAPQTTGRWTHTRGAPVRSRCGTD